MIARMENMENEERNVTKKKILLVEDDEALQIVLQDAFRQEEFLVISARDGKEGLETALAEHPDLILLDVNMPVMDGITALKKLREDSWGKSVPVIMLTNSADMGSMAMTMESHILQYVVKSDTEISRLIGQIRNLLAPHSNASTPKVSKGGFGVAPAGEMQREIEYSN